MYLRRKCYSSLYDDLYNDYLYDKYFSENDDKEDAKMDALIAGALGVGGLGSYGYAKIKEKGLPELKKSLVKDKNWLKTNTELYNRYRDFKFNPEKLSEFDFKLINNSIRDTAKVWTGKGVYKDLNEQETYDKILKDGIKNLRDNQIHYGKEIKKDLENITKSNNKISNSKLLAAALGAGGIAYGAASLVNKRRKNRDSNNEE